MSEPYVLKASPQPNKPTYGLEELNLSPRFTRAIHKERFGQQAAPWDKARPIKRWADFSVADKAAKDPNGKYEYHVWVNQNDGTAKYVRMETTNKIAATFNLPGVYDWPKYVMPPAKGWYQLVDGNGAVVGSAPIAAEEIANQAMCQALIDELETFGIKTLRTRLDDGARVVWDPTEDRRFATIYLDEEAFFSVARLLQVRHKNGVGAPGEWKVITSSPFAGRQTKTLVWVSQIPDDTNEFDPRPETPIPMRQLSTNEEIRGELGGVIRVWRTDLGTVPGSGTGAGGGLTGAERAILDRIDMNVQNLVALGSLR